MTVLVVGGAGFIGAYLARRLLRDGVRVVVLDSPFSNVIHEVLTPEELGEVTLVSGDVNSLRDLGYVIREHGVRRLVNLAALLHPACDHNPPKAVQVNVEGQLAVLEAARLWNLEKVVWASSVVVFGDRSHQQVLPVPNDAPHHPVSVYGATKSFAEFLTTHYIRTWGVDAVGLRFALVYGPGRVRGATAFVNELLIRPALGQPAKVPFGDDVVDWQYVEDVAALIAKCLSIKRTKTPVFNTRFCVRSIREVGQYVESLLPGARIDYEPGTFGVAWETDDSLLQEEVGFTPAYMVERGVLDTINYVRRRYGLPPVVPSPNVGLDTPGKGAISG